MRYLGLAYMELKKTPRVAPPTRSFWTSSLTRRRLSTTPASGYALEGNTHVAFEWLGKAKATGKLDMTQIQVDEDLKAVSTDPRFAALLPKPSEFANPFVETEKVVLIREWLGEAQGDQFGWIARSLGDVDGDGAEDFVTSSPTWSGAGKEAGRVYVYSTKTGKLSGKSTAPRRTSSAQVSSSPATRTRTAYPMSSLARPEAASRTCIRERTAVCSRRSRPRP